MMKQRLIVLFLDKNRTHATDKFRGTWPTTVEQRTTVTANGSLLFSISQVYVNSLRTNGVRTWHRMQWVNSQI